ncbi:bola-like protein [Violaceomyces palustris]|uniref:Bola-like protein n=1 Tax=Violaceomyces palustris TaxID=1673888 RepID=A0ACD0P594_9BASI|nr:bola-like protein [Violaceomyces palustris]
MFAAPLARAFASTTLQRDRQNDASAAASATPPPSQGEELIVQLLTQRFKPAQLKVQDVSGGCGSFYAISISSKEFKGLSTIKAHRMVNEELKEVIKGIHGLQLRTMAEE